MLRFIHRHIGSVDPKWLISTGGILLLAVALMVYAVDFNEDNLDDAWQIEHGFSTNAIYPDDLIGWWSFNNTSQTNVLDRSGNNLTGALTNFSTWPFVSGLFSNALSFSANSYVDFGSSDVLSVTNHFTISAWVNGGTTTQEVTFARWEAANGKTWKLGVGTNGIAHIHFMDTASTTQKVVGITNTLNILDQNWHHVAGVMNWTNSTATIYVDGEAERTMTVTNWSASAVSSFTFGNSQFSIPNSQFILDDVYLYKRALTANEILQLPATYSDPDGDGAANLTEMINGTNPNVADTDGDAMRDGNEALWGLDGTVSNNTARLTQDAQTNMTWTTSFETGQGFTAGTLNGQQGWIATTNMMNGVRVVDFISSEGTNSVEIASTVEDGAPVQSMTRYIGSDAVTQNVVWIGMDMKFEPGEPPGANELTGNESVLITANTTGLICGYDGVSNQWKAATTTLGSVSRGSWSHLDVKVDYGAKKWALYMDGSQVLTNINFKTINLKSLSRLSVEGKQGREDRPSYVDNIQLSTATPANLDSDADGMPDSWEMAKFGNLTKTGSGDQDNDGLTNLEEYRAGTNPNATDTDGDGINDLAEVESSYTNPLVADFNTSVTNLTVVTGATITTNSVGRWAADGTVIYAQDFRGSVEYIVNAPASGAYRLEVEGTQRNPLTTQNTFDLYASVDGVSTGFQRLIAGYGTNGKVWFYPPWLGSGNHTVKVEWVNGEPDTFLQINAVRLQSIGGPDNNSNGRADWIDNRLVNLSTIVATSTNLTSPLCQEGTVWYVDQISVAASSTTNNITVNPGLTGKWYANVPLSSTNNTVVVAADAASGISYTNTVHWKALNLLETGQPTERLLRKGDALRLVAYPTGTTNGTVSIAIAGVTNYTTTVDAPVPHTFDSTGNFTVTGQHIDSGVTNTFTQVMRVRSGAFNGNPFMFVSSSRDWINPDMPNEAAFEADPHLTMIEKESGWSGRSFRMAISEEKTAHVIARLGGGTGPILHNARVDPLRDYTALQVGFPILETYSDGSQLVEGVISLSQIPPDMIIKIKIFTAGVILDDGTIHREIDASDFDALGQYRYRFIKPASVNSSTCHTITFYQGDLLVK